MQVDHVVCAFCGCVCDDISVTVEGDRITKAKNACVLGKSWFLSHGTPSDLPVARIEGKPVSLNQGIEKGSPLSCECPVPAYLRIKQHVVRGAAQSGRPGGSSRGMHRLLHFGLSRSVRYRDAGSRRTDLHPGGGEKSRRSYCLLGSQSRRIASPSYGALCRDS